MLKGDCGLWLCRIYNLQAAPYTRAVNHPDLWDDSNAVEVLGDTVCIICRSPWVSFCYICVVFVVRVVRSFYEWSELRAGAPTYSTNNWCRFWRCWAHFAWWSHFG